jgi:ribose 5-phosphate isomerase B
MRIAFGCDHAGWVLKQELLEFLARANHEIIDMGTDSSVSVDYPDFAARVAESVSTGRADIGILVCGTGLGMAITANKFKGVRAVTVSDGFSAKMARAHNDANVLTLGARVVGPGLALDIVNSFLSTPFEGGRHQRRVDKIRALDASVDTTS